VNIENTEIEAKTSENDHEDDFGVKSRSGPGKPSEPPVDSNDTPSVKRGGSFLAFLALLLSLAAIALSAWTWWQGQASGSQAESEVFAEIARLESGDKELELKIKQVRDEVDTLASGDVGAEFQALQRRIHTDREQLAGIEQGMQEQMALSRSLQAATSSMQGRLRAAEAAVAGMSTRELDGGGELDLAEVDYLLRLANERLKLFNDPAAADEALEVADMHLAALDNPMYLGVRQDIAAARRELAAVGIPDYLEIANRVDAIQEAIPALVFLEEETPAVVTEREDPDGWWGKISGAFSSLVTVRRSTDQENQRISLEDMDYVRQRLWLQMEISHLALMRRDQDAFRSSLERTMETIDAWFDPAAGSFAEVSGGIDELLALEIKFEVPDITAPWSTLRLLRNAAPSAAVPVDAPPVEEVVDDAEQKPAGDNEG
jgi:uroporphyrin-3 C-methyltransferase